MDDRAVLPLLTCPRCHGPLRPEENALTCPADGLTFTRQAGIWSLIDPARQEALASFLAHYATVRRGEGWGSSDPAYYSALPFRDLTGKFPDLWRIRARSFRRLQPLLKTLPRSDGGPARILDLGAGNGWLSHRLTEMGFAACAVDLSADDRDGLGAAIHHPTPFPCVLAEFERLPFAAEVFDVAIFNASLHYAPDPISALLSTSRTLFRDGRIFLLDSPIYRSHESGEQMIREMRDRLTRELGLKTWVQPGPGYLTFAQIDAWAAHLRMEIRFHRPNYGLRWELRPLLARLRGSREPATFRIVEMIKK